MLYRSAHLSRFWTPFRKGSTTAWQTGSERRLLMRCARTRRDFFSVIRVPNATEWTASRQQTPGSVSHHGPTKSSKRGAASQPIPSRLSTVDYFSDTSVDVSPLEPRSHIRKLPSVRATRFAARPCDSPGHNQQKNIFLQRITGRLSSGPSGAAGAMQPP